MTVMIMQVTTVQVARGRVTAASLQITLSMLSISTTGMPAHAQLYLKIAPLCGWGSWPLPIYYMVPLVHPSHTPQPSQHLDLFSCFCSACQLSVRPAHCAVHTDRHTDHGTSVTVGHILMHF